MKNIYSIVIRNIENKFLSMCLENGITAEGNSKEESISSLMDALESVEPVYANNPNVIHTPISIDELHEFLKYGEPIDTIC